MAMAASIAVGLVAVLHFGISIIEMFFWKNEKVYTRLDRFHFQQAEAEHIAPIVANAGLYNAFIAAGLVWSILPGSGSPSLQYFFLSCVVIAGIYGGVTLKPTTFLLQTLPAFVAMSLVWMANNAG